ncbi:OmdA-family protein [Primorskyibacter flagellatus]|uniref:OmdA-family protein n=1 Tax=Primorskyibacter flagellatus TaxID=1387277 RepID=A0A916ZZM9_9RHOB|nr:YdeI/OmpD-associated family protein [Primorskyibacter flagellatus]GGE18304.1 OmdA-family protein [Primorskyibacter flagellatus]
MTAMHAYFDAGSPWQAEAMALREILLDCGLEETEKWRKPCYVGAGGNICILQKFNDFIALMFFRGALLDDREGLLRAQGENSRSAKRLEFTDAGQVAGAAVAIRGLVASALDAGRKGLRPEPAGEEDLPEELADALDADPALAEAFQALTPGRRRGYVLTIREAKQAATRRVRIAKHRDRILAGKGLHDR